MRSELKNFYKNMQRQISWQNFLGEMKIFRFILTLIEFYSRNEFERLYVKVLINENLKYK